MNMLQPARASSLQLDCVFTVEFVVLFCFSANFVLSRTNVLEILLNIEES